MLTVKLEAFLEKAIIDMATREGLTIPEGMTPIDFYKHLLEQQAAGEKVEGASLPAKTPA